MFRFATNFDNIDSPKSKNTMRVILCVLIIASAVLSLISCDPCTGVNCGEHGECESGDCFCAPDFEGPNCDQEKIPDTILIVGIRITKHPISKEDGSSWDPDSGPDLSLDLFNESDNDILFQGPTLFENTLRSEAPFFKCRVGISDFESTQLIRVYDVDEGAELERVGDVTFNLWKTIRGSGFPRSSPGISNEDGTVETRLSLQYVFNE